SKPFYVDYLSAGTPVTPVGDRNISYHGRCFDMGGDDFGVGSGWVEVVAVGYKLGLGEANSLPKRVVFFDIIEAPLYVSDANDSNLVKVEFTGNGFEYKVLKVPDFNLSPWDGSVVGTGMPVFGGENMNIGLDFKEEPKSCDSKLSASVSMDGTSFVFTKGCDGSTKREVHREVPVAGIELPELPGGVEVEAFATADFYLTHEEGLEPPWRTGGTLNLGCTFSFSTPEVPGPPVCGVPTYTRADLSLELGLSSSLEGWVGTGPELSSLFYFEPLAKGILGAGVSGVACVEGYVGGGFHSEINLYPKPITWGDTYIILVGGVEVIIGPFSTDVGLEYNWWLNPGVHTTITTSGFEVLPRDYLNSDDPLVLGDNEDAIDCNVFPYSVPEVVPTDSGMLAVWIEDGIGRDAKDRTELRYATYEGHNWTLHGSVFDDLTADMNPQLIALPNNNAACIWQDANGTLADCNSLEALNEKLEIAVWMYDSTIQQWMNTAPVPNKCLTNDNYLDRSPKLAAAGGSEMIAVWVCNENNDMWGNVSTAPNKIMWARYNGGLWIGPDTIALDRGAILGTSLAYNPHTATYTYIFCVDSNDSDPNINPTNQDLWMTTYSGGNWSHCIQLINDDIGDAAPRLVYDSNSNNLLLFWVRGDDIRMAKEPDFPDSSTDPNYWSQVVVTCGESWGSKDFDLVMGNSGQIALVWSDISIPFYPKRLGPGHFDPNRIDPNSIDPYKDQFNLPAHTDPNDPNRILVSHDLWVSYHDPNFPQHWSLPRQLTWDDSAERFVSGAFEPNGTLLCVYNKRQTKYETVEYKDPCHHDVNVHNVPFPGRSDLVYLRDPLKYDLSVEIEDVRVMPPNPMPGTEAKIYATVKNLGVSPVSDIKVAFSDLSDPTGGTWGPDSIREIKGPLVGGDACTVSMWWEVPAESVSPRLISVIVYSCGIQDDSNWNNNSINFKVLAPDLTVSEMIVYNAVPNKIITARVANKGVLPTGLLPAYGVDNPVRVVLREGEPNGVIGKILAVQTIQSIEPMAYYDAQFILPPMHIDVNMVYAIVDMISFVVVDDFELYTNDLSDGLPNLNDVWEGSPSIPDGGEAYLETDIVHFGEQSMRFSYDNTATAYSVLRRIYESPQDWTEDGVTALRLYFYGDADDGAGSTVDEVSVTLEDSDGHSATIAYVGDASDLSARAWLEWNIHLQDFNDAGNVEPDKIVKIELGISGGTTGRVYFDDIQLYSPPTGSIYFDDVSPYLLSYLPGDMNGDCVIGYADLKIISEQWLGHVSGLAADLDGSNVVDFIDYCIFSGRLSEEFLRPTYLGSIYNDSEFNEDNNIRAVRIR
ncbi:MAG: hypothetical protein GWN67_06900, partial [Phycisphaerae bacterium]|nr:hypothetical protein [Phycisphaerae bacterium]NIR64057.1 hypothetical protein [candidate division Zixibacteria bacterium]NIP51697.1 hypothetical protein [Phycisphaerae bacterium]NIS50857.1 hypothetical protein [Phycisphaerae bacterium]NIU09554.1 hypothetical protein [Phycisphaerae bacterium]